MTVLPSNNLNTAETPPLAELRKLKSQTQTGERRRQLRREHRETSKKAETKEPDPEPHQTENIKPKRKTRSFFKWLFEPAVATSRKVAPPPPPRVRVKIPIVYRNGKHKGVVVGGLRDTEVDLNFPDRLAWEVYEAEQKRKEEEKKTTKEEKLARELAK
ncbi:hypothetical protein PR001_g23756 [Phytophthora rubi]|uniref:Uncharacterized protein n=1 Tax=Phytophthora rubi TaxID=129364 RepID=A0A6A3IJY6_9STRA|nr:hypothetical protein PR001_g23756 [Phytophthora rubi]KAE9021892.1 hypothetical protein PR002_g12118 [Phytophthora rubi]